MGYDNGKIELVIYGHCQLLKYTERTRHSLLTCILINHCAFCDSVVLRYKKDAVQTQKMSLKIRPLTALVLVQVFSIQFCFSK